MASYISAKKKESSVKECSKCKNYCMIVGLIRNDVGELESFCKICFEEVTGKKVSKR